MIKYVHFDVDIYTPGYLWNEIWSDENGRWFSWQWLNILQVKILTMEKQKGILSSSIMNTPKLGIP